MLKKILLISVMTSLTITKAFANAVPYVGGSVGINTNTSNIKISNSILNGGNFRGVPFNIFIGYGGVVNQNFYLAGELFSTLWSMNISDNNKLKTSYSYGMSFIPGVMLSDHTLMYLRFGVLGSRFSQQSLTRAGGQLGLGMQTSLTQNFDVRAEYDYVAYRSYNDAGGSVLPRSDQVSLGLIYKFD